MFKSVLDAVGTYLFFFCHKLNFVLVRGLQFIEITFLFHMVWIMMKPCANVLFLKTWTTTILFIASRIVKVENDNLDHISFNDNVELHVASKKWILIYLRFYNSESTVNNFISKCKNQKYIITCVGCFQSLHQIISKYNQQCTKTNACRSGL